MSEYNADLIPKATKLFDNKGGYQNAILRLTKTESLEEGVERLRRMGWVVPDLGQLAVKEGQLGKYIELK